jgi:hypothetical protein
MKRSLNSRERRLLIGCLATIFIVVNFLAYRQFDGRRTQLNKSLKSLKEQQATNKVWLDQKDRWQKREQWLQQNMKYTDSAGRSQGQLLEELQSSALDAGLKVSNTTPLEAVQVTLPNNINDVICNEVAVSLKVHGDQTKVLNWLLTLQSPERFQAMKAFEIELDTKSKEKTPQAQCNLTMARWFNPNPPPNYVPPAAAPAPEPLENPLTNPLTEPDLPAPEPAAPATAPQPAAPAIKT